MKVLWMVAACVALGALPTGGAIAQGQQQFETPLYTTSPSSTPDKNYGLPSFGMQGAGLPQKATGLEKAGPSEPDFFAGSTPIALPKVPPSGTGTDTPLYTTTQGSTTDGTSQGSTTDDTSASASDTDTMTTGDTLDRTQR